MFPELNIEQFCIASKERTKMNAELLTLQNMLQTLHGKQVRLKHEEGYLNIHITGEYRHQPLESCGFCHVGDSAWFKTENVKAVMFDSSYPEPVILLKSPEE